LKSHPVKPACHRHLALLRTSRITGLAPTCRQNLLAYPHRARLERHGSVNLNSRIVTPAVHIGLEQRSRLMAILAASAAALSGMACRIDAIEHAPVTASDVYSGTEQALRAFAAGLPNATSAPGTIHAANSAMQGKYLGHAPLADEVRLLAHGIPPEGARPSLREIEAPDLTWSDSRRPAPRPARARPQSGAGAGRERLNRLINIAAARVDKACDRTSDAASRGE
jgi:hypothetical protein